jgi:hypothetical protein
LLLLLLLLQHAQPLLVHLLIPERASMHVLRKLLFIQQQQQQPLVSALQSCFVSKVCCTAFLNPCCACSITMRGSRMPQLLCYLCNLAESEMAALIKSCRKARGHASCHTRHAIHQQTQVLTHLALLMLVVMNGYHYEASNHSNPAKHPRAFTLGQRHHTTLLNIHGCV